MRYCPLMKSRRVGVILPPALMAYAPGEKMDQTGMGIYFTAEPSFSDLVRKARFSILKIKVSNFTKSHYAR